MKNLFRIVPVLAIAAMLLMALTAATMNPTNTGTLANNGALTAGPDIIPAPASAVDDAPGAENDHQQAFDEAQGVVLPADVSCDGGVVLPAGMTVNSHMIFLNTPGPAFASDTETWTFDGDVLCVMSDSPGALESATSGFLGAPGTAYPGSFAARGLEGGDSYLVAGNAITVTMVVTEPGDWIRVVTEVPNEAPDCSGASASPDKIWPPDHSMVDVSIMAVTDPDGDPFSVMVTGIFQDEPVNDGGDGDTSPDGAGVGTDTAQVRAERAGDGDGRVYHIMFTATDAEGNTCSGEVRVGVPHDKKDTAVDGGPLYDSTTP